MFDPLAIKKLRAIKDHVLVYDMKFDQKITHAGIILLADDSKLEGIHPRWAKVYAVGPTQQDVKPGQYVLVKHGRWTRGLKIDDGEGEKILRRVDNKDILLVSNEPVQDETIGDGI